MRIGINRTDLILVPHIIHIDCSNTDCSPRPILPHQIYQNDSNVSKSQFMRLFIIYLVNNAISVLNGRNFVQQLPKEQAVIWLEFCFFLIGDSAQTMPSNLHFVCVLLSKLWGYLKSVNLYWRVDGVACRYILPFLQGMFCYCWSPTVYFLLPHQIYAHHAVYNTLKTVDPI